jgi:hypothetical protein
MASIPISKKAQQFSKATILKNETWKIVDKLQSINKLIIRREDELKHKPILWTKKEKKEFDHLKRINNILNHFYNNLIIELENKEEEEKEKKKKEKTEPMDTS